jgi:hypothetical protein
MTLGGVTVSCGENAVFNVIDRRVRFKLRDVCIPDLDELLATLYGEQVVEGTIIDVSGPGDTREGFAVVQMVGMDKPVVVPLALVLFINGHSD